MVASEAIYIASDGSARCGATAAHWKTRRNPGKMSRMDDPAPGLDLGEDLSFPAVVSALGARGYGGPLSFSAKKSSRGRRRKSGSAEERVEGSERWGQGMEIQTPPCSPCHQRGGE